MKRFFILYRDRAGEPHEMELLAKDKDQALAFLRVYYPPEHYGPDFVKSYHVHQRNPPMPFLLKDHLIEDADLEAVAWLPFPAAPAPAGVSLLGGA